MLIVDAGGGTIDVSAYRRTSMKAESYEEIAPPQCLFPLASSPFAQNLKKIARRFQGVHLCDTKCEGLL